MNRIKLLSISYLLIHGQFEHFAPTLDGRDEVAFTFKAGEFSGEVDLVMNHRSLLGLRTTSGCSFI